MSSRAVKPEWTVRVNARIDRSIPPDRDAGRVAAMFGVRDGFTETLYREDRLEITPGEIVAIVGPSGAGKTVLLREIADRVPQAVSLRVASLGRSRRPAVGALRGGSLKERLAVLSRCGLAEALALVTPAKYLSGGQLYRLALGRALHEAARRDAPTLVIADEFADSLDPVTAWVLSRQIRKHITGSRLGLIVATRRAELLGALRPDRVLVKAIAEPLRVGTSGAIRNPGIGHNWRGRITRGTIRDYDGLSGFHYLSGRPATHKRVYVVRAPGGAVAWGGAELAAVLVVSPPLANVRGRNVATGGRYCGPDRTAAMALLNAEVECISRVVVHPVFRGCGLAVRLVRHAIATRQTPLVEALAATGAVHPFFEKAGMTAYPLGPSRHIDRFISAAEAVGIPKDDLPAVEPVRKLLASRRRRAVRFLRDEIDLCLARTFSVAQLSRLADPLAELCRRTARQYVYYLVRKRRC